MSKLDVTHIWKVFRRPVKNEFVKADFYLLWHFGLKNFLSLKIVYAGHSSSFPEAGPVKQMEFSIWEFQNVHLRRIP